MVIRFSRFGLSENEIEEVINKEFEKNADLLIGIDDPEVLEMMDVLKKSIAKAISINNEKVEEKTQKLIEENERNSNRLIGRQGLL